MGAYEILLASPVIALVAIALLWTPYRVKFGKIILARDNTPPVPPPTTPRVEADAEFPKTLYRLDDDTGPGTIPAPTLASRDSALPVPMQANDATAATLTGARLVDISGTYNKRSFPIPATGVTIGRSPYHAEIVLRNPRISSRHAWIGFVGGTPVLRDLNSTNGTFLNGHAHSPVTEAALRPGDTIYFANCQGERFRFVME